MIEIDEVDFFLTDPPYPDHLQHFYGEAKIDFLNNFSCRQFVFWSSKCDFPLDYSAIHIWDKKCGAASEYERIFERNGSNNFKVFRFYLINSSVAACLTGDEWTGHPSQKPVQLIESIIIKFTKQNQLIFDPFMGSGTTGVAALKHGRKFIGIEKNPVYFSIAYKRIKGIERQGCLFPTRTKIEQLSLNQYGEPF